MPLADLGSSFEAFFNAAARVLPRTSRRSTGRRSRSRSLCLLAMQLARAWAWRNVLRAAYPGHADPLPAAQRRLPGRRRDQRDRPRPRRRRDQGLPRQAPDPRLLLPGGHLLLPRPDGLRHHRRRPRPPLRDHPGPAAAAAAAARPARLRDLLLGRPPADARDRRRRPAARRSSIAIYLLAHRVRRFWDRVKQGVVILTEPRRYLREVAAWQGVGWLCRFAAFWFFLEAFGIGGSFGNVMLVMSVQAIANIVPFTPGRRRRPAGAAGRDPDRALAHRRPLLLGRHPDRDGGLVGGARLRRDPARLPHHRLARADPGRRRTRAERAKSAQARASPAPRASRSARPARVAAARRPLPGRLLAGRELVVVAAGQGLERDQGRVVLEQDRGRRRRPRRRPGSARRTSRSQPRAGR